MLSLQLSDGIGVLLCWLLGAGIYLLAAAKAQRERNKLARCKRAYDAALSRAADYAIKRVRNSRKVV